MKKLIALLLALVLCFGLCACGGKIKEVGTGVKQSIYVGTYHTDPTGGHQTQTDEFVKTLTTPNETDTLYIEREMTLRYDGSGRLVIKSLNNNSNVRTSSEEGDGIKIGDILCEYAITWTEAENYIIVNGSGTNYMVMSDGYLTALSTGNSDELSEMKFKLDGVLLVPISGTHSQYIKVN